MGDGVICNTRHLGVSVFAGLDYRNFMQKRHYDVVMLIARHFHLSNPKIAILLINEIIIAILNLIAIATYHTSSSEHHR